MTVSRQDAAGKSAVLGRVMRPLNSLVEKLIPSALVFAIALTLIVGVLALIFTDAGPIQVVEEWGIGLAGLLEFITQMALILFLGYILANTRPARKLLRRLATVPRTAIQAYLFVFLVAALASLITWGLGLVVGGLLAREVAHVFRERAIPVHFPMLVAAGFSGFVVWHMGYSASGPLTAATPDSFVAGQLGAPLPVGQTIFSTWNIIACIVTIAVVALALYLVAPRDSATVVPLKVDAREADVEIDDAVETPADRVDASRIPTTLIGLMLVAYLIIHFSGGGTLTLDVVNWSFLGLIMLLVRSPFELIALTKQAASNVGEILLQFPLYAGILGIMAGTGLMSVISEAFVAISTPQTFALFAFLSAGLVNFFVPSGGGQIAVQAPILLEAAEALSVDPALAIMAVAYGDQWTNMIQPFWALPLLAIAGLKMRDILSYTTIVLIASGLVFGTTLLIVSM
ncbi:short-chain fatty acid transporter [Nesterenkonia sandarakina]|uniref:Short-chain fatty acids transporter n=1 Tax=Nesterenkonia sandarakina TaxID=272918 RepID=A0A7Z0E9D5_9MICC|nr:TIGR00366 family protein [Nesterenkonia sandarakina]NYJ17356.1 short-chain fatty acids transporter [Nesterenkonia sandarakina]